jgi:hypothetical protein
MHRMFLIRRLISTVLLLAAFPLFTGGAFEIEGMMGLNPNLFSAIALSLGAQLFVVAAGFVATPLKKGKVGFVRAVAFVFLLLQSIGGTIGIIVFVIGRASHTESDLDSKQMVWILIATVSAITLLWLASRAWDLSLGSERK